MDEVKEPVLNFQKNLVSIEEYLAMEKNAIIKHEYLNGEVFVLRGPNDVYEPGILAMAGAGQRHNEIFSNLFVVIGNFLKDKKCRIYGSDLQVFTNANENFYTYPDISIQCNKEQKERADLEVKVIIEILSPTTRSYDMGEKFRLYRNIESLEEYILIDAEKIYIEKHQKIGNEKWELEIFRDIQNSLPIQTIQYSMPLKEIYQQVFSV